jgi:hypothetical protein
MVAESCAQANALGVGQSLDGDIFKNTQSQFTARVHELQRLEAAHPIKIVHSGDSQPPELSLGGDEKLQ